VTAGFTEACVCPVSVVVLVVTPRAAGTVAGTETEAPPPETSGTLTVSTSPLGSGGETVLDSETATSAPESVRPANSRPVVTEAISADPPKG
jgi:hypothetical protein